MTADIQGELERLSQDRLLAEFTRELSLQELITVYLSDGGKDHSRSHYCALVNSDRIENSLATRLRGIYFMGMESPEQLNTMMASDKLTICASVTITVLSYSLLGGSFMGFVITT